MNKTILILANNAMGLYKFRKELLESLINNGYTVFCSLPFDKNIQNIFDIGCICIDTKISRHGTNPFEDLKLLLTYVKLIKRTKPTAVLTYTIKPNVYGGLACQLTRTPYMANVTGLGTAIQSVSMTQKLVLMLYKLGLKRAKKIFFQNKENQDFMINNHIVTGFSELLPGSGVNLEEHCYEEYPKNEDNIVLLTIGRIMRDKGTGEILQAAETIKSEYPNVIFCFIGSQDENYQEQIECATNAGTVEYLGSQPNVHAFIAKSHATLHASYHEGMANVLLETAASGRPIIATDVSGCKETYDDGISGISFKPRNVDDTIRAIKEFLTLSNQEREQMGKRGREKMEKEFDRNIVVEAYMNALSEIEKAKGVAKNVTL